MDPHGRDCGTTVFEALMSRLDYPMFVVTTAVGRQQAGCLVGFSTQVSIEPSRFLVAISTSNRTYELASRARYLAVHALAKDDTSLAQLFGAETGDDIDKFARCSWSAGPYGLPILDAAAAWFGGEVLATLAAGDHTAFLLSPIAGAIANDQPLLAFTDVRDLKAGHEASAS